MTTNTNRRFPPVRVGLLTVDAVNEMYASIFAEETGDVGIAADDIEVLQREGVDAIAYDTDHLRNVGDPLSMIVPKAARVQIAFGYNITIAEAKVLRWRGVIVCRRLKTAVRLATRFTRKNAAVAA